MVFAVLQPGAFVGLAAGFVIAVMVRVLMQSFALRRVFGLPRPGGPAPRLDRDVDVAGVLAAVVSGAGFGASGPGTPATTQWGRRFAVTACGSVAVLVAGQALFALAASVGEIDAAYRLSDVLRGVPAVHGVVAQVVLSMAVAVTAFGVVALLPVPSADGWAMLVAAGVVAAAPGLVRWGRWVLLAALVIPYGDRAVLHVLVDVLGAPLIRPWQGALPCRGD